MDAASRSGRWPCWPSCRSTRFTPDSCCGKAWSPDVDSGGLDADRGLACRSRRASDLGLGRGWREYAAGLAVLSRTTGLALLAAAGLFALVAARPQAGWAPLLLWGATAAVVCLPWAWATLQEYGTPFYSYTSYFEYNFSWTVHHYEKGNTLPSQFYTLANLPEIVRVKVKSLFLIVVYSTMIVGLADRPGLLQAPGPEPRSGATRPTCWSRRSSWCSCWRRSRASPTSRRSPSSGATTCRSSRWCCPRGSRD